MMPTAAAWYSIVGHGHSSVRRDFGQKANTKYTETATHNVRSPHALSDKPDDVGDYGQAGPINDGAIAKRVAPSTQSQST